MGWFSLYEKTGRANRLTYLRRDVDLVVDFGKVCEVDDVKTLEVAWGQGGSVYMRIWKRAKTLEVVEIYGSIALLSFCSISALNEIETGSEMPNVSQEGGDLLKKLALLNKEAKKMKKGNQSVTQRKEKEQEQSLISIDTSGSSSPDLEIEEVVPPTPSKLNIYMY